MLRFRSRITSRVVRNGLAAGLPVTAVALAVSMGACGTPSSPPATRAAEPVATQSAPSIVNGTYTIRTVAGNGVAGSGGDGGPATSAQLTQSYGVGADAVGNFYIADHHNSRVRKVDPAGIITNFAGTGSYGLSGDGGPATAAQIRQPWAVKADASGNVYILDFQANNVRKVAPNGVITTVAGSASGSAGSSGDGGPATAALLRQPTGLAVDGQGDIFILDSGNAAIRMVSTTGTISTIVGSMGRFAFADASLNTPSLINPSPSTLGGIVADSSVPGTSTIYFNDMNNFRVRKATRGGSAKFFATSTVAGTGVPGNSGDGGPATSATFTELQGLTLEPGGNLVLSDSSSERIRQVNLTTGIISALAGTGAGGFSGDGGPATEAAFNFPEDLATDACGRLLVMDRANLRVRRVDVFTIPQPSATPAIGSFALYAERSVSFANSDLVCAGDVGVHRTTLGSFGPQLTVQSYSDVPGNLIAPSVSIAANAVVGNVETNTIQNSGTVLGAVSSYPASMPPLPLALSPVSAGAAVTVATGTKVTLSPGIYGDANVSGSLVLAPGTYTFGNVTLAENAQLVANPGGTNVQLAGQLVTGSGAIVQGTTAGQLSISVAGGDASGGTPTAVSLGSQTQVTALSAAPRGTVTLGLGVTAVGAFAGFDVKVGQSCNIIFQSGLQPSSTSGTPLAGYTLPPSSAPIVGPVPGNMQIGLAVVLPVNDNAGLQTFIAQVTDPTNSMYRSYMSISTFAAMHGDSPTEYAKVAPWAAGFGLTATTYANNLLVDVQGTAAEIEQALSANLLLALRSDGTVFYEPDRLPTPSLPTAFDAIQLMDTYAEPQPAQTVPNPNPSNGPLFGSSDLRTAYLGPGSTCSTLTGAGQSIGIVAFDAFTQFGTLGLDGGVETDDIKNYEIQTNINGCQIPGAAPPCTPYPILRTVNAPPVFPLGASPGTAQPSGTNASVEAAIDVEMAIAMAPGAQIVNVEGQSIDSILSALATTPRLNQISDSWFARSSTSQVWLDEFAAQGQSFFEASGDAGEYVQTAESCTCPCTTPGSGATTTETLFACSGSECVSVCGPLPSAGVLMRH